MPKFVPILHGDVESDVSSDLTYKDILEKLPKGPTRVFETSGLDENEMVMQCFNNCSVSEDCQSWTLDVEKRKCYQYDDHVRLNGHQEGFYSGVKVYFCIQGSMHINSERFAACLHEAFDIIL